jgi:2-polyprenyl-6-methoxyphenol hydroxylase-like FAD-dependent oxidoreductase
VLGLAHNYERLKEFPSDETNGIGGGCWRSVREGHAFALYERERREKVDWTVSTSWTIGRMCHLKNYMARALQNAVLKKVLSGGGKRQIRKLYSIA